MVLVREGRIEEGRLVVADEIGLPDGTAVCVAIEVLDQPTGGADGGAHAARDELPGFGMWADREDMPDSVTWVNRQRDAWRERLYRRLPIHSARLS